MSYSDKDGNNKIETAEIIEQINYYPFGLAHKGYNQKNDPLMKDFKYQYNGKENQEELGLNVYDYGARNYDAAIGRWMNVDPLAEKFPGWNPYHYVHNNPINLIDPTGMSAEWVPGTDGKRIDFKIDSETQKPIWTTNTSEEFKEIANTMLETTVGSEVLRAALDSDVKINVSFKDENKIDIVFNDKGGIEKIVAEFGENIPTLSVDRKALIESNIIIYKGTTDELNSKHGSGWEMENPDTRGIIHSGKLTRKQNYAGTLGHEFMHTLDRGSSSALSPNSSKGEIERRPRQFSEMFYFQILNKK